MGFRGPSARRVELLDAPGSGGRSAEPVVEPFDSWRAGVCRAVFAQVEEFVAVRCAAELGGAGVDIASDVLLQFVTGGKCLRSMYAYLGWLCAASEDDAALRA